jgi:TRAP-type C4-dicarboxylate transport system permease small subunit
MVARWTGEVFPGAASYAGYAMAAASFLAFANALNRGAHIRVSVLLNALPAGPKRLLEIWCFGLAAAIAWYFTYYAYWFVYWSWKFNEVSQSQDATSLWIPQSVMVVGGGILAIALTDNLLYLIVKGKHRLTRDLVDQSFGE